MTEEEEKKRKVVVLNEFNTKCTEWNVKENSIQKERVSHAPRSTRLSRPPVRDAENRSRARQNDSGVGSNRQRRLGQVGIVDCQQNVNKRARYRMNKRNWSGQVKWSKMGVRVYWSVSH